MRSQVGTRDIEERPATDSIIAVFVVLYVLVPVIETLAAADAAFYPVRGEEGCRLD